MEPIGGQSYLVAVAMMVTLGLGLTACAEGADDVAGRRKTSSPTEPGSTHATSATTQDPSAAFVIGLPVLIETRVVDAAEHRGVVLKSSVLGESAFCPGGRTSGGSEGAAITTTLHCSSGTLTIRYAPTQRSLVQGAVWEVVGGTGTLVKFRGGGSMVAVFDKDDPDGGREVFTGSLGR